MDAHPLDAHPSAYPPDAHSSAHPYAHPPDVHLYVYPPERNHKHSNYPYRQRSIRNPNQHNNSNSSSNNNVKSSNSSNNNNNNNNQDNEEDDSIPSITSSTTNSLNDSIITNNSQKSLTHKLSFYKTLLLETKKNYEQTKLLKTNREQLKPSPSLSSSQIPRHGKNKEEE
jgi:hypothetical protein